jgi:hypothetical protein
MSRFVQIGQIALTLSLVLVLAAPALAQDAERRPASPTGKAATQVGGEWVTQENGRTTYQGGQWMEISYGRPILRGRTDIFGAGDDYGDKVTAGAPLWRAGANVTTRLWTEAPIVIGGTRLEPGSYSLFVDLAAEGEWTLVVSKQPYQESYDPENEGATWGAYGYDDSHDVARAKMTVEEIPHSVDELTIAFHDVSDGGGEIAMLWEHTLASVPFRLAESMEEGESGAMGDTDEGGE